MFQSSDSAGKDAWKDKGAGQLLIKCKEGFSKGSKESKPTIVVRNDVRFLFSLNLLVYFQLVMSTLSSPCLMENQNLVLFSM